MHSRQFVLTLMGIILFSSQSYSFDVKHIANELDVACVAGDKDVDCWANSIYFYPNPLNHPVVVNKPKEFSSITELKVTYDYACVVQNNQARPLVCWGNPKVEEFSKTLTGSLKNLNIGSRGNIICFDENDETTCHNFNDNKTTKKKTANLVKSFFPSLYYSGNISEVCTLVNNGKNSFSCNFTSDQPYPSFEYTAVAETSAGYCFYSDTQIECFSRYRPGGNWNAFYKVNLPDLELTLPIKYVDDSCIIHGKRQVKCFSQSFTFYNATRPFVERSTPKLQNVSSISHDLERRSCIVSEGKVTCFGATSPLWSVNEIGLIPFKYNALNVKDDLAFECADFYGVSSIGYFRKPTADNNSCLRVEVKNSSSQETKYEKAFPCTQVGETYYIREYSLGYSYKDEKGWNYELEIPREGNTRNYFYVWKNGTTHGDGYMFCRSNYSKFNLSIKP